MDSMDGEGKEGDPIQKVVEDALKAFGILILDGKDPCLPLPDNLDRTEHGQGSNLPDQDEVDSRDHGQGNSLADQEEVAGREQCEGYSLSDQDYGNEEDEEDSYETFEDNQHEEVSTPPDESSGGKADASRSSDHIEYAKSTSVVDSSTGTAHNCGLDDVRNSPHSSSLPSEDSPNGNDMFKAVKGRGKSFLAIKNIRRKRNQMKVKSGNREKKLHVCETCGKAFRLKAHLKKHLVTHAREYPIRCSICNKGFQQKRELVLHTKKCHPTKLSRSRLNQDFNSGTGHLGFKCHKCHKSFSLKCHLTEHLLRHKGDYLIKCGWCMKGFWRRGELIIHIRKHHSNGQVQSGGKCESQHQDSEGNNLGNAKNTCSSDVQLLQEASRVTSGDPKRVKEKGPPFVCKECGKNFDTKWRLERHLASHSKQSIFKCDVCKAAFLHHQELLQHMTKHKYADPKDPSQDMDTRKSCSSKIRSLRPKKKTNLDQDRSGMVPQATEVSTAGGDTTAVEETLLNGRTLHVEVPKLKLSGSRLNQDLSSGTGNSDFECPKCHKSFSQKGHLNEHLLRHKGDYLIKCGWCMKGFWRRGALIIHIKKYHPNGQMQSGVEPESQHQDKEGSNRGDAKNTCSSDVQLLQGASTVTSGDPKRVKEKGPAFVCKECGKNFDVRRRLKLHLASHSEQSIFKCDVCKGAFLHHEELLQHMTKHKYPDPKDPSQEIDTGKSCSSKISSPGAKERTDQEENILPNAIEISLAKGDKNASEKTLLAGKTMHVEVLKHKLSGSRVNQKLNYKRGKTGFECLECHKYFSLKCNLKDHLLRHSGDYLIKCGWCMKGFWRRGELIIHIRKYHPNGQMQSGVELESQHQDKEGSNRGDAKNTCSSDVQLLQGASTVASGDPKRVKEKGPPFVCKECGKNFDVRRRLKLHLASHSEQSIFKCDVCKGAFLHHEELLQHMTKHKYADPKDPSQEIDARTPCSSSIRSPRPKEKTDQEENILPKATEVSLARGDTLQTSLTGKTVHVGVPKRKLSGSRLNQDLSSGIGNSDFECPKCHKSFSQKGHLNEHLLRHKGDYLIKCGWCMKGFWRRGALIIHIKKYHPNGQMQSGVELESQHQDKEGSNRGDAKNTCSSDVQLLQGASTVASGDPKRVKEKGPPFVCKECGKNFDVRRRLKLHLASHSEQSIFKCDVCKGAFLHHEELLQHMTKHKYADSKDPSQEIDTRTPCSSSIRSPRPKEKTDQEENILPKATEVSLARGDTLQTSLTGKTVHVGVPKRKLSGSRLNQPSKYKRGKSHFECLECHKSFSQNCHLSDHLLRHEGDYRIKCGWCMKGFWHRGELIIHIRKHHSNGKIESGEEHESQHRDKEGSNLGDAKNTCSLNDQLLQGASTVTSGDPKQVKVKGPPFVCKECGKNFDVRRRLELHLAAHSEQIVFKCDVCKGAFLHHQELLQHMKKHISGTEHQDVVNTLSPANNLARPKEKLMDRKKDGIQEEQEEFFHRCGWCMKGYIEPGILIRHIRRNHSKLDQSSDIKCVEMNDDMHHSVSKDKKPLAAKDHSETQRKPETTKVTSDQPKSVKKNGPSFVCNECGKTFRRKWHLKRHMGCHSHQELFRCEVCHGSFLKWEELVQHIVKHVADTENVSGKSVFSEACSHDTRATSQSDIKENGDRTLQSISSNSSSEVNHTEWLIARNTMRGKILDMVKTLFENSNPCQIDMKMEKGRTHFACPECDRTFSHKNHLNDHLLRHKGEYSINCGWCMKGLWRRGEFITHVKNCHSNKLTHSDDEDETCSKNSETGKFNAPKIDSDEQEMLGATNVTSEDPEVVKDNRPLFVCDECDKEFNSEMHLEQHMGVHFRKNLFRCEACKGDFLRHQELVGHLEKCTANFADLLPANLKERISIDAQNLDKVDVQKVEEANMLKRVRKPTGRTTVHCDQCGEDFGSPKLHRMHSCEQNRLKTCSVCGKVFNHVSSCVLHTKMHFRPPKKFHCSLCDKTYKGESGLTAHNDRFHREFPRFTCHICGKGLWNDASYRFHMKRHNGLIEKKEECKVCSKTFRKKFELKVHMARHTGKFDFQCSTCGKMFAQLKGLKIHERVHTGERPFACKYCSQRFARVKTRVDHERRHTGEKPHKCKICQKAFIQRAGLYTHMKTHKRDGKK